jgi:hypothetical protein
MLRIPLLGAAIGAAALGIAATGALADIFGTGFDALKPAVPPTPLEKVHEGKGSMHQNCLRHAKPGAYPDCHWHYFNPDRNAWEIRRRLLDGTPCPENENCSYDSSR